MRCWFLCPLLLGLAVQASAQDTEPSDEPVVPDKLDKVALTLDAGGHTAKIRKVFFLPDGKQVITLGMDHTIRLWDVETGQTVKVVYPPGAGGLHAAALSPDGKLLAVASRYPEGNKLHYLVYVLALPDGRVQRVLKGHTGEIEALAFAADGKRLASSSADLTTRIWDLAKDADGQRIETPNKRASTGLAFSPDGSRLACIGAGKGGLKAEIIDLNTGKETAALALAPGVPPKGGVLSFPPQIAWSPDGKTLATASWSGLQLWDPDGKLRSKLLENKRVLSAVFSADSRTVLATWEPLKHSHRATLVDVATAKELVQFAPHPRGAPVFLAMDGALSPDGKLAITGGGRGRTDAFIWNTSNGAIRKHLAAASWILSYQEDGRGAWTPDGKSVAVWNKRAKAPTFDLEKLQFGPLFQDTKARGQVTEQGDLTLTRSSKAGWVVVNKDGKTICKLGQGEPATLVGKDRVALAARRTLHHTIALVDVHTSKVIRRWEGHDAQILHLVPSPDGRFLMSLSADQMLRIWSPERDKPLLSLYVNGKDWVLWTPEGYYAASPNGERLMGWKIDNGLDKDAGYYPAEQFHKVLYRPDVLQRVLAKGSVEAAVQAANEARKAKHQAVPRAAASPEKLLPPGVTLAVVEPSQLPKMTLKVSARQSCPEQPIKSLRLLVDGRPLPNRQASLFLPEGKEQAQHEETWTVELPPGKHKLSVLARSKDDTPNASNVIAVSSPLPENERPVIHHLAIGISNYDNPKLKLNYADADARQLADAVAQHCAGHGNLYRAVQSRRLLNQDASHKAVLDAIEAVRTSAKANDLFLLSFAGHGVREEGEYFLLTKEADTTNAKTLEATAVSGAALREKLADFPCQVLLLLDACHSGAFGAGALAGYRPASDEAARALTDVEVRVAVMCAALGHEEALEQKGNGLFTQAVLRALQRDPDCFFDRQTGELNVYHLQAFVSQEVARASDYKQTPFLKMPLASPPFVVTQFPK